jgi:hypothetical protein
VPPDRYSVRFESFGFVAEVSTDDSELFDAVPAVLPPGWRPATAAPSARFGVTRAGVITLDDKEVGHTDAGDAATIVRLGSVLRHHLAEHAADYTFIHAGVVCADSSAGGIVIPGRSYTGKTTLVAELVSAGATYYSDEYAVVDGHGLIHPFAKPLSVRLDGSQELGALVPVADSRTASQPVRARLILVTRYEAGARWEPTVRSTGEGAEALLANTVPARARPRAALAAVSAVARGSRVLAGTRGEAAEVAAAVLASATAIRQLGVPDR